MLVRVIWHQNELQSPQIHLVELVLDDFTIKRKLEELGGGDGWMVLEVQWTETGGEW